MRKLIGLTGPKRAGKDTAAAGIDGVHLSFAKPLKDMLRAGFGLTDRELEGDLKEEPLMRLGLTVSPRYLAQTLGTEWGRWMVDPDVWVKLLEAQLPAEGVVKITDVRFDNEADMVRRLGILVHIVPPADRDTRGKDSHASEAGIGSVDGDAVIFNNGSVEVLQANLRGIIENE